MVVTRVREGGMSAREHSEVESVSMCVSGYENVCERMSVCEGVCECMRR